MFVFLDTISFNCLFSCRALALASHNLYISVKKLVPCSSTFQIFISSWSSSGFLLISVFLSFFLCRPFRSWGRWQSWKGMLPSWSKRTPGAGVGHGGYPGELVSGPHVWQGQQSQWVSLFSSGAPSPVLRVSGLPLLQSRPPLPLHWWPQRRKRWHGRMALFPQAHLTPLLAP